MSKHIPWVDIVYGLSNHDTQAEVYAELGEVAAGTKKLPPFNEEKKFTVFKSLGKRVCVKVALYHRD